MTELAPTQTTLPAGPIEDGWLLVRPLVLTIEREDDGWYVVSDDVFNAYGDAATFEDALQQYRSALVDQFEFLLREAENNQPGPKSLDRATHWETSFRPGWRANVRCGCHIGTG